MNFLKLTTKRHINLVNFTKLICLIFIYSFFLFSLTNYLCVCVCVYSLKAFSDYSFHTFLLFCFHCFSSVTSYHNSKKNINSYYKIYRVVSLQVYAMYKKVQLLSSILDLLLILFIKSFLGRFLWIISVLKCFWGLFLLL